ncbi:hypothetical protein, partial [Pseudomonas sp. TMW22089]|uniref:hypothetical protein n=1 Tax=Pseudomonas sp. TMW22089 TaxID=2506433 RepID=UPI001F0D7CF7
KRCSSAKNSELTGGKVCFSIKSVFFEPQTARPLKTAAYFRPSLGIGRTKYYEMKKNGLI